MTSEVLIRLESKIVERNVNFVKNTLRERVSLNEFIKLYEYAQSVAASID